MKREEMFERFRMALISGVFDIEDIDWYSTKLASAVTQAIAKKIDELRLNENTMLVLDEFTYALLAVTAIDATKQYFESHKNVLNPPV